MPDEYNESLEKLDIFDYIKWFPSRKRSTFLKKRKNSFIGRNITNKTIPKISLQYSLQNQAAIVTLTIITFRRVNSRPAKKFDDTVSVLGFEQWLVTEQHVGR